MDAVTARCPVCSTPITQTRYAQIQEQIRKEEQAKLAVQADKLKAQHDVALKAAIQLATRRAGQEAQQKLALAQASAEKQAERIAELQTNEATLRANASRTQEQLKRKFDADLKVAAEKAAKDARATVMAQLNAKEVEVRALKDAHAQELKQQREALDEHRDLEIQKVKNARARETEVLQKKVQELSRKLEQKTANELGEMPEIDLHGALRDAFPGDNIRRVKKGETGADIVHDVMHNGQYCQTIVYDSKNRKIFQAVFVQKLLTDKANAKAEHAVIVTAMFPSGHRDLCMVDGVIVARPQQVVTIAALLRDSIITDHLRNLSFKDRTVKKERLYALITSEMFRQRMASVERAIGELEKIDIKEEAEHRKVWTQRNVHYRTAAKSVRDLITDVNVILQNPKAGADGAATGTDDSLPF
jgi:hypothetical protein